jgi:hypothetical protein
MVQRCPPAHTCRALARPVSGAGTPGCSGALELYQLGARKQDAHPVRAEVHEHGYIVLYAKHRAEPILVMRHQIAQSKRLDWHDWIRDIEGTCGQMAPGRSAESVH